MEHIYLYGDISPDDGDFANMFGTVSLSSLQKQIQATQSEDITIHIRSHGGSVMEGFAIYDFLKTCSKNITMVAEGICASIATVVFLAGNERKITENCEFLIHFPMGIAAGTADELEATAEVVREAENKIIDFYVAKTGADRDILISYMEKDKIIDAKQAKNLGFVTEIIPTINAEMRSKLVAQSINKSNMTSFKEKVDSIINSLKGLVSKNEPETIVNLEVMTANADVTLNIKANGEAKVGDEVTLKDGGSAEGEHLMPNGDKYIVASGKLSEIIPYSEPVENPEVVEMTAKLEAKEAEIIALKETNELLKSEMEKNKTEQTTALGELAKEIEAIKKLTVSNYQPPKPTEQFRKDESDKSFADKVKERQNELKNKK
jgi:ATP-dependent Clp endopeptidase proteolytic subunit ClpP